MNGNNKLPLGLRVSIVSLALSETILVSIINTILPFMTEFYLSQDKSIHITEGMISEYSGYFEAVYRLSQVFACLF